VSAGCSYHKVFIGGCSGCDRARISEQIIWYMSATHAETLRSHCLELPETNPVRTWVEALLDISHEQK